MPYGLAARQRAIAEFSPRDAERLPDYDAALETAAAVLRELVLKSPPNVGGGFAGGRSNGRPFAPHLRLAARWQAGCLPTSSRKARPHSSTNGSRTTSSRLASPSTASSAPMRRHRPPGTAYVLLHHCFGEVNGKPGVWGHAIGGMGAITQAMALSAESAGAEIRTHAAVREVLVENGRAAGVRPCQWRHRSRPRRGGERRPEASDAGHAASHRGGITCAGPLRAHDHRLRHVP